MEQPEKGSASASSGPETTDGSEDEKQKKDPLELDTFQGEGILDLLSALPSDLTPMIDRFRGFIANTERQKKLLDRQGKLLLAGTSFGRTAPSTSEQRGEIGGDQERKPSGAAGTGVKRKSKKVDHHARSDREEHLPPMNPIPQDARKIANQGGVIVYHWIGSP